MGADERIQLVDRLIFDATGKHLSDLQTEILKGAWEEQTYDEIAESLRHNDAYIRDEGAKLFKSLSKIVGETVTKTSFRTALERYCQTSSNGNGAGHDRPPNLSSESSADSPDQGNSVALPDPNFVGREAAVADLDRLIEQGAKLILICGEGGQGKTTLARKYLEATCFDLSLEVWMATETQNITPVESVVEEWLRRDFGEEPGREFGINLERLKRKLRDDSRRIGVLIDNLEPALDRNGRFIEAHRRYVDLLRTLADPSLRSVTLITSRERLYEASVGGECYTLEGLNEQVWRHFFRNRRMDGDSAVIAPMCQAYGGNAKAMKILTGAILKDFEGDVDAYWQEMGSHLLQERELQNLVSSQFDRLQQIDPEAYRLLCRLGCYRYQDIPFVSLEGINCLLWDLPASRRRTVIRALQDRSLLEGRKTANKYWLHPVIRVEAVDRLRSSTELETTNRTAAEFWTGSVQVIESADDTLRILEAYHHYIEINDFERACDLLVLETRQNNLGEVLPVGWYCQRFGLMQQMVTAIALINSHLQIDYRLGRLYNLLGYIHRQTGLLQEALACHQQAEQIATTLQLTRLKIAATFDMALCQRDLAEYEIAVSLFDTVCQLAQATDGYREYLIYSQCCLAYLHSCLQANETALQLVHAVRGEMESSELTSWGKGQSLLLLGSTYRNLGNPERSFEYYAQTIQFCEENQFTAILAKAINGVAQLHRQQRNFEQALASHLQAIDLLDKLRARCELADAYFQMGLTYQAMGNGEKSMLRFQEAIDLFTQMHAPRQVERVQQAMGQFS